MTQSESVLKYMEEHGGVSRYDAFNDLHILNLPDCILTLRRQGYAIETSMVKSKNKKTYGVYRLKKGGNERAEKESEL